MCTPLIRSGKCGNSRWHLLEIKSVYEKGSFLKSKEKLKKEAGGKGAISEYREPYCWDMVYNIILRMHPHQNFAAYESAQNWGCFSWVCSRKIKSVRKFWQNGGLHLLKTTHCFPSKSSYQNLFSLVRYPKMCPKKLFWSKRRRFRSWTFLNLGQRSFSGQKQPVLAVSQGQVLINPESTGVPRS